MPRSPVSVVMTAVCFYDDGSQSVHTVRVEQKAETGLDRDELDEKAHWIADQVCVAAGTLSDDNDAIVAELLMDDDDTDEAPHIPSPFYPSYPLK